MRETGGGGQLKLINVSAELWPGNREKHIVILRGLLAFCWFKTKFKGQTSSQNSSYRMICCWCCCLLLLMLWLWLILLLLLSYCFANYIDFFSL